MPRYHLIGEKGGLFVIIRDTERSMWFDNETESCPRAAEKFRHKTMHVCSDPLHIERETLGCLTVAPKQFTAADVQELISV